MKFVAFFTDDGAPKTGLTPTIRIRDLSDNSLVVTDASMTEVGEGIYSYNYTSYNNYKDYAFRCDGGVVLSNDSERYSYGVNNALSISEMSEEFDDNDSRIG